MLTRLIAALFVFIILLSGGMYLSPGTSPIVITSPETGSMEPTISPSDVVILYGWGTPNTGDVILFDSDVEEQAVLHRVVDIDSDGKYITRGDANEIDDQDDGFRPVSDENVYGVVVGGENPYTIPGIGLILSNTLLLLTLWLVLLVVNIIPDTPRHNRAILTQSSSKTVVVFLICILLIALPLFTYLTMATADVSITTVNNPSQSENVVAIGEMGTDVVVFNYFYTFLTDPYIITDNQELSISSVQYTNQQLVVNVANEPQEAIGVQSGNVKLYTYVGLLPSTIIYSLIDIHYLIPAIIDAMIISIGIFLMWYVFMNGLYRSQRKSIYKKRKYVMRKLK